MIRFDLDSTDLSPAPRTHRRQNSNRGGATTDSEDIWSRKRKKLHSEEKMEPLVEYVQNLHEDSGEEIPNFDPDDGGMTAEVLFLLSDPGPTVKNHTWFVSRDNYLVNPRDRTAKNVIRASAESGLHRERTISWNVIPWAVEEDNKIKDIEQERAKEEKRLSGLLGLFEDSNLRAIALFGGRAWDFAGEVKEARPNLRIFEDYHPGWRFIGRADHMEHLIGTFRQIKEFLDS